MVDQDPCSGSVAGDSGHRTLAVTPEAEPVEGNRELIGAVGGIDEKVSAECLSDVEWKDDDPQFEFDDENVTIPQTPATALTPVQALTENETFSPCKSPLRKEPCFQKSIAVHLSKAA